MNYCSDKLILSTISIDGSCLWTRLSRDALQADEQHFAGGFEQEMASPKNSATVDQLTVVSTVVACLFVGLARILLGEVKR